MAPSQTPSLTHHNKSIAGLPFDGSDLSNVLQTTILFSSGLNLSPTPEFSSPLGSSFSSTLPLQVSPELPASDRYDYLLPQPFPGVRQEYTRAPLTPFSPPLGGTHDNCVTSAPYAEIYNAGNHQSLLFQSGNEPTFLDPLDPTIEVVSSFGGSPLNYSTDSLLTTYSGGLSGSGHSDLSLFLPNTPLTYQSSPGTDYSSPVSLTVPTDSQVYSVKDFPGGGAANSHERVTMSPEHHYPHSPSAASTLKFDQSPHIHEPGGYLNLTTSELHLNTGQGSPVPSSAQSDVGSVSDVGNPVIIGPIASEAHRQASEKRRKKIPKYLCSYCPQRLTSNDNRISELTSFLGRTCLCTFDRSRGCSPRN